jgi:Protein of unknown function (DUF3558)
VNIRTIIVMIGALATLAGCTVRSSGDPSPTSADGSSSSPTSATTETTDPKFANLLPPRPRELDLAGVDPCKDLLTEGQLRELAYDLGYARPPQPDHSDIHGGPDCTFSSTGRSGGTDRNIRSLVGISTTEGALAWVTDPARVPDTRPEVVTVEGFHALVLLHPKIAGNCLVVVDTAEGQYLEVTSSQATGEGTGPEPFCAEAERVAGMAIKTISASR